LAVEDGLVAVDKPAGISSIGLALDDEACLQHHLIRRFGGMVWGVHQLDKDTTGVNLFVLEKRLVEVCRRRMTPPSGEKRYVALCAGTPRDDAFTVEAPIGFLDADERFLGVTEEGKAACSDVRVLARGDGAAAIEVRLRTGRTHQIRIHLAHVGHPLLGEPWYRDAPCERAPRQMLHARSLTLGAGDGRPSRTFVAPWPDDLRAVAASSGLPLDDGR
ncbi:MAG: RluA family pseudouridine synthase, partial [Planctomycetota bacterium JB042]